jgi:hypothetical protein
MEPGYGFPGGYRRLTRFSEDTFRDSLSVSPIGARVLVGNIPGVK